METENNTCAPVMEIYRNACTCSGSVVGIFADGVLTATCENCGEVEPVGTIGDIDLTTPSPLLFAPVNPTPCLSCGAVVGLAPACPACGAAVHVVFESDTGRMIQGFMTASEAAALPFPPHDDGEEIPY